MKDGRYEVVKDIVLQSGREMFKKGIIIYRTNGVYYTERGMLPPEYQDFLRDFMREEEDLKGDMKEEEDLIKGIEEEVEETKMEYN